VDSSGNLFFSDFYNSRIRKLSIDGTISTAVDLGSQVPNCASTYWICSALSIALDPSGNLAFSTCCYGGPYYSQSVFEQSPNGAIVTMLGSTIAQETGVAGPS
jgi:hypothetical protein